MGQVRRCLCNFLKPNNNSSPLTFWLVYAFVDWAYSGHHLMTLGFMPEATWRVDVWDAWWVPFWKAAQEYVKKNSISVLGGPGTRTQVPMLPDQRTHHSTTLLLLLLKQVTIIILRNWSICWKRKITRVFLNKPMECQHVLVFFLRSA